MSTPVSGTRRSEPAPVPVGCRCSCCGSYPGAEVVAHVLIVERGYRTTGHRSLAARPGCRRRRRSGGASVGAGRGDVTAQPSAAGAHSSPSTRATSARSRVNRWSAASVDSLIATACMPGPLRSAKSLRVISAALLSSSLAKSAGRHRAAAQTSRHRHRSTTSVSLARTVVAKAFSPSADGSSERRMWALRSDPFKRRRCSVMAVGGHWRAVARPGTSVVTSDGPTRRF